MTTKQAGLEGLLWFIGEVEDINDPLQIGRVKVRCFNIHTDSKIDLPTSLLPWSTPIMPVTSAGTQHIGQTPVGLQIGSIVVGFFMDSSECQIPVIWGSLAGKPDDNDLPQEAYGSITTNQNKIGPEPDLKASPKYPFNQVMKTEAGHLIEIDNTTGFERINIRHKSGSYIVMDSDGNIIIKSESDNYNISSKKTYQYSKSDYQIESENNINLKGQQLSLESSLNNIKGQTKIEGNLIITGTVNGKKI